jgi:hypothetical protein
MFERLATTLTALTSRVDRITVQELDDDRTRNSPSRVRSYWGMSVTVDPLHALPPV